VIQDVIQGKMKMPPHYAQAWTKQSFRLPHGIWPDTLVNTAEAATILGCAKRTLERYRRRGIGPEPEPVDLYLGRARYYRVWKLMAWRSSIIGEGPKTYKEAMTWFCENGAYSDPRTPPYIRPEWHPRGEFLWRSKSLFMRGIKCRIARIEFKGKCIELGLQGGRWAQCPFLVPTQLPNG
jgi:hypothetical protein